MNSFVLSALLREQRGKKEPESGCPAESAVNAEVMSTAHLAES